jgi:diketogulonate reductase-like aldo/keto reductase
LTELAIERGFRGIDTANQRRHYDEAAVGRAIAASISKGVVGREDLFLQTKFTFRQGQDHRLPYDPKAAIPVQVEQSFAPTRNSIFLDRNVLHWRIGKGNSLGTGGERRLSQKPVRATASRHFELGDGFLGIAAIGVSCSSPPRR